jgi:radical SAM superfamily enzyme YgiQ (UPF0313 family)
MNPHRALSILLVHPSWRGLGNRKKVKVSERKIHPLTLGVVAAIIRRHDSRHRVRIVNQAHEAIPWDEPCDLVGITVNTYTAPIAGEIAARFRQRGVPVIMGGPHASLAPEACRSCADAVVTGEAEEALPELLDDFIAGKLKPLYRAPTIRNPGLIPVPDRSRFNMPRGNTAFVQATRGCGNACRFCYLGSVSWGPFRARPVRHVLDELAAMRERIILFVDDNMFTDRDYCLELFAGLRRLGKHWWAQAPTTLAADGELLQVAADSGCFSLSYGFQTVKRASIACDHITHNRVEDYVQIVRESQRRGILVDGTFIFGFDGDDESVFDETADMILRMNLDTYTIYYRTVYPGTPAFEQLRLKGRLLAMDYAKYDWDHPVVQPLNMTAEQLERGLTRVYTTLDHAYRGRFARTMLGGARLLLRSPALAGFLLSAGLPRRYVVRY